MIKRISNFTKNKYTHIIRDIVSDLGRPVEVFKKPTKHECFNCFFDKLTNSSTNNCKWTLSEALQMQSDYEFSGGIGTKYKYFSTGRCPICKGKGYLETQTRVRIKCKIIWDPEFDGALNVDSSGVSGSTNVELKTDPKYRQILTDCAYMMVDGAKCVLAKPPVLRGIGEKSILVILAFTTDNISLPKDDDKKDYI
jgi:hypothetical protein